jgi:serine/threonine protein kinase
MSRHGQPKANVKLGGPLYEAALGSIYFATIKNSSEAVIVKTIDLKGQNIWAVTRNNKRTTIRGLNDSNVIFLCQYKEEADEWASIWCGPEFADRSDVTVGKVAFLQSSLKTPRDGATGLMRLNEYLSEAVVGLIVSKTVKLPNIIKTKEAWIENAEGHILQDYGGISLMKNMADLTLDEFKSILVQILCTLAIAQETCHLKHHDVHLDNVFLHHMKDTETFNDINLKSKDSWAYTVKTSAGPKKIVVKHCGILAKLGDFGLASASYKGVRYERVDYGLLDSTESEWGQWSGGLENQKSYDAVVFLSKFFLDDERSKCPAKLSQYARSAYAALRAAMPHIECSNIGRPLRGLEGNMSCADILALPFFEEFHDNLSGDSIAF